MRNVIAIAAASALAIGMVACPQPAQAAFIDGQALLSDCEAGEAAGSDSLMPFGKCVGYLLGALDQFEIERLLQNKGPCVPDGANARTMKDIVRKYLRDHPEQRTLTAAFIVRMAIRGAYPACAN